MSAARNPPGGRVPRPAHPSRRREPLPGNEPKSLHEDPAAPDRIRLITADPSYPPADQDVGFLTRDDTRGVRLQLDYQKPQLFLGAHGIRHAIVVFGSTRLAEPAEAKRRVAALLEQLDRRPGDARLIQKLAVARRVLANSHYYEVAMEFGRLVGEAEGPAENRLALVTGGGPGIMEAANRGAYQAGARTVGLNITLPNEQFPNPYITPGLCFSFHYFAIRKLHFLLRAKALVAFPGGYGTLDEVFETLMLIQTRKIAPLPVVLVGEAYWRRVFDPDFMVSEGTIDPEDRELFWFAETASEIWDDIQHWYELSGRSIDD